MSGQDYNPEREAMSAQDQGMEPCPSKYADPEFASIDEVLAGLESVVRLEAALELYVGVNPDQQLSQAALGEQQDQAVDKPDGILIADEEEYAKIYGDAYAAALVNEHYVITRGIGSAAAEQAYADMPITKRLRSVNQFEVGKVYVAEPQQPVEDQGYEPDATAADLSDKKIVPLPADTILLNRNRDPSRVGTKLMAGLGASVMLFGVTVGLVESGIFSSHPGGINDRSVSAPKGERSVEVIGDSWGIPDSRSNFEEFTLTYPDGKQVVIKSNQSEQTVPQRTDLPEGSYEVIVSEGGPNDIPNSVWEREKIEVHDTESDEVIVAVPWW